MADEEQEVLREALKRVAVALKESGFRFALAGGYAVWARGGPEPDHDVDFVISEAEAAKVADVLAERGFRVEQPPEDWLFKVYTDGAMVDLIFRSSAEPVRDEMLTRASEVEVLSVVMPVISATDVMINKLRAMDEHMCDFGRVLPVARALREQIDWDEVREETGHNDFASAFLFLVTRMGVIDGTG